MGVMNEAIEDSVGGGGIADLFVPARDGKLRGQDRRARLIAILADQRKSEHVLNAESGVLHLGAVLSV